MKSSDSKPDLGTSELDPLQLWKQGQADGLILRLHENERPLQGLSGRVDWEFHGALSRFLEGGFVSGALEERVLVPLRHRERKLQVLLWGSGSAEAPGQRAEVERLELQRIEKRVKGLLGMRWMISKSDFGDSKDLGGKEASWILTK